MQSIQNEDMATGFDSRRGKHCLTEVNTMTVVPLSEQAGGGSAKTSLSILSKTRFCSSFDSSGKNCHNNAKRDRERETMRPARLGLWCCLLLLLASIGTVVTAAISDEGKQAIEQLRQRHQSAEAEPNARSRRAAAKKVRKT